MGERVKRGYLPNILSIQTVHVQEQDNFNPELLFDHTPRSTPLHRNLSECKLGNITIQYWWEHYNPSQHQPNSRDTYYLLFTCGEESKHQELANQFEDFLITQYPDKTITSPIPNMNMFVWNVFFE